MRGAKYVTGTLLVAIVAHFAFIFATPRVLMSVAFDRLSAGGSNTWTIADRVTPLSRAIVRPSPDFAYAACAYDLADGPIRLRVAPWHAYWSLSLYAANSDNYYVIDDREARNGAVVTLMRPGTLVLNGGGRAVESPSTRGIALIRRLAPTPDEFNRAREVARDDLCASFNQEPQ